MYPLSGGVFLRKCIQLTSISSFPSSPSLSSSLDDPPGDADAIPLLEADPAGWCCFSASISDLNCFSSAEGLGRPMSLAMLCIRSGTTVGRLGIFGKFGISESQSPPPHPRARLQEFTPQEIPGVRWEPTLDRLNVGSRTFKSSRQKDRI